jgi:spermidine/putrescine transport system substrate-binding protein
MKSAEDENSNRWIVPVFLIFCVLLMVFVLVRRYIKSKKDIF